ncbi:hypothetical protein BDN70DRAFT_514760 [Pholiota conissans]|uniref:Uncharacterized protein n=1 Tax=Pholiota conissans TaxID=109636 RepID=A0A9P5YMR2_9AGAR|nr:hypothetical protein BDN70DRAFT_514760 [Pholiota conissans]
MSLCRSFQSYSDSATERKRQSGLNWPMNMSDLSNITYTFRPSSGMRIRTLSLPFWYATPHQERKPKKSWQARNWNFVYIRTIMKFIIILLIYFLGCKNLLSIMDLRREPGNVDIYSCALMERRSNRYTFPVAFFDKSLALFQYRLENLDAAFVSEKAGRLFPNELDFYRKADKFISAASTGYSSVKNRFIYSSFFFEEIVGYDPDSEYKDPSDDAESGSVNGSASTFYGGAYTTTIKNDRDHPKITRIVFGVNNQEDILPQMTKMFAEEVYGLKDKEYFESTLFPRVFIILNENRLQISVAICLETIVVNEILNLAIWDNFFRPELKQKLARVAMALRECAAQLDKYYSELKESEMHAPYFPSP